MRDDGDTHFEHCQRDTGGTEFRLLGTRHAVSALHRREHTPALALQSLAPHTFHFSLFIFHSYQAALPVQFQDYAVGVGRYYGEKKTGHYNQAYQWSSKGFLLVQNMLKQVDQTVLVGLHDEQERQLAVLRKMVRFTAFIAFPLLFGLGLVSHEFIVLAIGKKWAFSASLLPYLCFSGAFMPLAALLTDAIISHKRSDIYLWNTVVLGILQIGLLIGLRRQGIYTMVIAYTVLNILWVFVWHFFAHRLMGYRLLSFLKDILPFALAAAGVMAVTGFVTEFIVDSLQLTVDSYDYLRLWVLLLSRVVIATILYYVIMRVSGAVILKECFAFILSKKK